MKILVIEGNPKEDGLCRAITDELIKGAKDGGAEVAELNTLKIDRCRMCGTGWGPCQSLHSCIFGENDGFGAAQKLAAEADALIIISPVYWNEESESMKAFLDRLRRCERNTGEKHSLRGKLAILAASAGGTGNGTITCLEELGRFCSHTGMKVYDYISVNRWNREYKAAAAYAAACALASGVRG